MASITVESPGLTSDDLQQARVAAARMLAGEVNLSLPPSVVRVLSLLLERIGSGGLTTAEDSVGTFAAAEYLNVSRPYLVRLLKDGRIPYYMVGSHHRVYTKDLEAYKREQDKRSQVAMQKLHDLSEEFGLYDVKPIEAHE